MNAKKKISAKTTTNAKKTSGKSAVRRRKVHGKSVGKNAVKLIKKSTAEKSAKRLAGKSTKEGSVKSANTKEEKETIMNDGRLTLAAIAEKFNDKVAWVKSSQFPSVGNPDQTGIYQNPDGGWQCNYANWCAITIRPGEVVPHETHGAICARWYQEGGAFNESGKPGKLGYPISDEEVFEGDGNSADRISHFEHGDIIWSAEKGETRIVDSEEPSRQVVRACASGTVKLYLSHNPYKIETVFRIDGNACEAPWFVGLTNKDGSPSRLQMWIGEFFDKFHDAYPAKEKIDLTYRGTFNDCRDVSEEAARAAARLGVKINVFEKPCGDPSNKFKQLKTLYDRAITGPYEDFHKLELKGDFRKVEERLLRVAIMATMKNGKSTLLNSILGHDLLPSATQRCTQLISYIEHCAGMQGMGFEAKCVDVRGNASEYLPCDKETLEQWNRNEDIRNVWIRGEFPRIQVGDCRLQFVDTPGPNSATHPEDEVTIDHFLSDNSLPMVCYIVDILDDDEADYLKKIQKQMRQFGKQSEDRFIFIVTKMDQLKIAKGETTEQNQYKSKIDDIKAGLMRIGGISNPRIFPVSAWLALKARTFESLDDEEQDEVIDDVKKFRRALKRAGTSLLDYTSVSSAIRNKIEAEIAALEKKVEDNNDDLADQLRLVELQSGIPALEMAIEEYATKYSVPARIYDAATVFDEGIQKANAIEQLAAEMEAEETSLDKINKSIEQLNFFLSQGPAAQEMRANAFPEKWQESQKLKDDLSAAECRFDDQIKNELRNWRPQTLDANDNLDPDEAHRLANSFVEFLSKLSTNMLRVYTRSVEEDAHEGFKKLQRDYQNKLGTILGDMPQELTDFLKRVPVLSPIEPGEIDTQKLIEKSYEEYKHRFSRPITVEKDGLLCKIWSLMPLTATEVMVEETRKREVSFVSYSKLVNRAKDDASLVLQTGLERAIAASATIYADLRRLMMEQFDRFDARLSEFKADLTRHLEDRQGKTKIIATYKGTLAWVRNFQEDLSHILDLEA